jgi:hypothetical protein
MGFRLFPRKSELGSINTVISVMGFCCNERKLPSLGSQGALLLRVRLRFIEVLVGASCSIAGYGV